ncbi:MAG: hypothetical protein JWN56_2147 [Sphingobacteriales bacterium]|nr:hypothetical protein [Sphingobacteriales bacterium]
METTELSRLEEEAAFSKKELVTWQNKMLPLMQKMIIGLTIFFFVASLCQLIYLHSSILASPKIDINPVLTSLRKSNPTTFIDQKETARLEALILLESNALERRHHQANILLMASIWIRYQGFVTGMILAFIGAIFILGKMQESQSILGAKVTSADFTIKSSSPGIILVGLGTCLMILTIVIQHNFKVTDATIYLDREGVVEATPEVPKFIFPGDSTTNK